MLTSVTLNTRGRLSRKRFFAVIIGVNPGGWDLGSWPLKFWDGVGGQWVVVRSL